MKANYIQTKQNDSNEGQMDLIKANWIKSKASAFKQCQLIQMKIIESNES